MELTTEKKLPNTKNTTHNIPKKTLEKAYRLMQTAHNMAILYDENRAVCNNGVGFDPLKLRKEAGIGLENLKARVAKLGGALNIDSGKGVGTTISIDIPITND